MKVFKKCIITILLTVSLLTSTASPIVTPSTVVQAATVYISKKTLSLSVGDSSTLKMIGTTKKVTWKSNNKVVVSVTSKGKVTAKASGEAVITATVSGKKYYCKVVIADATSSATKR